MRESQQRQDAAIFMLIGQLIFSCLILWSGSNTRFTSYIKNTDNFFIGEPRVVFTTSIMAVGIDVFIPMDTAVIVLNTSNVRTYAFSHIQPAVFYVVFDDISYVSMIECECTC